MIDLSQIRWRSLIAVAVAAIAALVLLATSVSSARDAAHMQQQLNRRHALREATLALQQPITVGYEVALRQTLDGITRKTDGNIIAG